MDQLQYRQEFYEKNILIYENDIYTFILSKVKDDADASDLRQITMEKAWCHLDALMEPEKAKSWLFQIANREILQLFRKQKQLSKYFADTDESTLASIPNRLESTLDLLIKEEDIKSARLALESLDPELQQLLTLRFVDEFTPQEIAKIYDEKPGTTRSKLSRALQKCREQFWKQEGGRDYNDK